MQSSQSPVAKIYSFPNVFSGLPGDTEQVFSSSRVTLRWSNLLLRCFGFFQCSCREVLPKSRFFISTTIQLGYCCVGEIRRASFPRVWNTPTSPLCWKEKSICSLKLFMTPEDFQTVWFLKSSYLLEELIELFNAQHNSWNFHQPYFSGWKFTLSSRYNWVVRS